VSTEAGEKKGWESFIDIQREIEATDRQIDQLVYELYGLMKDDIQITEEMT
jgi:hypothetical protein